MAQSMAGPMVPAHYHVKKIKKETFDTFTIDLVPETRGEFTFAAGQFNMLYVFGIGEVPISISGDPALPATITHTVRSVGTVTNVMRTLKRGDGLGVRGPFGSAWPIQEATGNDVVIVAGGIGLAPLRPAMYEVLAQRQKFSNVALLYGTRSPADILFEDEIKKWRGHFDLDINITVDRATGGWYGNVGVVPTMIPKTPFDPAQTVAMICGPEIMIRFSVMALRERGVPDNKIFVSMERNMKCAVGFCGHCQFGPHFICKDGPVFRYSDIRHLFDIREV